jgi:hypothetical protein
MFVATHDKVRLKTAEGKHIRTASRVTLRHEDGGVFCATTLIDLLPKREAIRQVIEMLRKDNTIGPLTEVRVA